METEHEGTQMFAPVTVRKQTAPTRAELANITEHSRAGHTAANKRRIVDANRDVEVVKRKVVQAETGGTPRVAHVKHREGVEACHLGINRMERKKRKVESDADAYQHQHFPLSTFRFQL